MMIIGLKKKTQKLIGIPLLILFVFSIYSGINKFEEKSSYDNLHKYMQVTSSSSDLIHELQRERGYSSGYISSLGKSFAKDLLKQRKKTDEKVKVLRKRFSKLDVTHYAFKFKNSIKKLLVSLSQLKKYRDEVDNFTLNNTQMMHYYTQNIDILLALLESAINISNNSEISVLTQSYIIIMKIQEDAEIERALINKVLSVGKLSNDDFYQFASLVTSQQIYIEYFQFISPQKYTDTLNAIILTKDFKEVVRERNLIYSKNQKNEILSHIKDDIGYGGLIHNFKNYVIRGRKNYIEAVNEQYIKLLLDIDKYKSIDRVTKEELDRLEIIKNVFLEYKNNLIKVTKSYAQHSLIKDIDKIVKVDDAPAIKALYELTSNVYGSEISWFNDATSRIDLLKKIGDFIEDDLRKLIDKKQKDLSFEMFVQFLMLLIVLIIIFLFIKMLQDLLESQKVLSMAQANTKSGSYEYYIKENLMIWSDEHYKLLDVDKKYFKPSFETYAIFTHPEDRDIVDKGIEVAISQKKISFFDYRIILYDNSIKYVRASAKVIKYNSQDEPLVMVGTIVDITDFKKLEQEIVDTQKDVIFTMGSIGESRSKETGSHVKRVAQYSSLLYRLYGGSAEEAELLRLASPMHDIGKVGIPDNILNKPGKLNPGEWAIMQTHTEMGYDMLKNSKREILKVAATVALNHHERYDGKGYPKGLMANEIPLVGRITALVDVFDALGSERCYKRAWELDKILTLIKNERAQQFDPELVDLFLENLEQFLEIREQYKDSM